MKVLCPKCGTACDPAHGYNHTIKFDPKNNLFINGSILIDCDECFTTFVYKYIAYIENDQVQTMKEVFGL